MNEYFEENKRSLIILAVMLFLLAAVVFFVLVRPLVKDYKAEQNRIEQLKNEIELLEAHIENLQDSSGEVDLKQLMLENKIPRERELDEYILALQQLELHTESRIDSIEFAYDSSFDVDEEETGQSEGEEAEETDSEAELESELEGGDADEEESEDAEEETDVSIDPQLLNEKPEQLQVLTVKIEALSPDFDKFIELLKIIESQDRISIVTSLRFTKPTEQDLYFSDNPSDLIPFEAELTTFYFAD